MYMQLILAAKEQRDDGSVCYRSVTTLGAGMGCDRKTAGKSLGKIAEKSLCTYTKNEDGVLTIILPNYKQWQEIKVEEVREKPRKNPRKIPPLRPDQTRPDQSRAVASPEKSGDHPELIQYWVEKYQDKFGVKYDFKDGKDGSAVKRLLKVFELETAKKLVDLIFVSDDPFYRTGGGVTLSILSANSNKLAQQINRGPDQSLIANPKSLAAGEAWLRQTMGHDEEPECEPTQIEDNSKP